MRQQDETRPADYCEAEKLCRRCAEIGEEDPWWPADEEFFAPYRYRDERYLMGVCRACFAEQRHDWYKRKRAFQQPRRQV